MCDVPSEWPKNMEMSVIIFKSFIYFISLFRKSKMVYPESLQTCRIYCWSYEIYLNFQTLDALFDILTTNEIYWKLMDNLIRNIPRRFFVSTNIFIKFDHYKISIGHSLLFDWIHSVIIHVNIPFFHY